LSERAAAEQAAGQAELPTYIHQQQPALSYFSHESSCLSASVNAFLNQPFTAVQHGSSEVYYEQCVFSATLFQIRVYFCNWFFQSVHDGEDDPQLVFFFSDEAWFSLRGEVNSQNNQYWSAENPRFIHKLPLHYERTGIWCATSVRRITGPIFYDNTVNSARYVSNILSPFFVELTEEERLYSVFQTGFWSVAPMFP
jgi:hypothetical protein